MKKVFFLLAWAVLQQVLQPGVCGQRYIGGASDGFPSVSQQPGAQGDTTGLKAHFLDGFTTEAVARMNSNGRLPIRGGASDGFSKSAVNFNVSVTGPGEICQGVDTAFQVAVECVDDPANYTFNWFKIGTPDVPLAAAATLPFTNVDIAAAGRYFCTVTSRSGITVYSDTLILSVHELPVVTILQPVSRDTLICFGDTLSIFGSHTVDTAVISWRGGGLSGSDPSLLVRVAPQVPTDYILQADNHGCFTEDTVTVEINKPFVNIPAMINLPEGNTLEITAVDAGNLPLPATGLRWLMKPSTLLKEGVNPLILPDERNEMVVEVALQSGKCTVYDSMRIVIKSGSGFWGGRNDGFSRTYVPSVIVTKNESSFRGGRNDGFSRTCLPPVILVQPTAGERQCTTAEVSLELRVVAEGAGISYRWEKFNGNTFKFEPFTPTQVGIAGEKSAVLSFAALNDRDNGQYRCVVRNECNAEVVSDTCYVSAKGEPVIFSGIHVKRELCAGSGDFDFNVIARASPGTGVLKYAWFKDGQPVGADTNFYKVFIGPTAEAAGTYVVKVSNDCGSVYDTAFLPVVLPPVIQDQSWDVYACSGGTSQFWVKTNWDEKYHYALYKLPAYPRLDLLVLVGESRTNKITLAGLKKEGYYLMKAIHSDCGEAASGVMALHPAHPVSITQHPRDTVTCAGSNFTLRTTAATAGEPLLTYCWNVLKKDGTLQQENHSKAGASSTDELLFSNVGMAYDSCLIWSEVFNRCDTTLSDTMVLRVSYCREMELTPASLSLCQDDVGKVKVTLKKGELPWSFHYDTPANKRMEVNNISVRDSSIDVNEAGKYRMVYLLDASGCEQSDGLPSVEVKILEPFAAVLSGGGRRCVGDTISLRLQVTGGRGPWEMWLADENSANEVGPISIGQRDTLLVVTVMADARYYIGNIREATADEFGNTCPGSAKGVVEVKADESDVIDFAMLGENHVGQCRALDLFVKLNPSLRSDGSAVLRNNIYYLNGAKAPLPGKVLSLVNIQGMKGEQKIICQYTNEQGCLVKSPEVSLFVDMLPFAVLTVPKHACGNVQTTYQIALSGASNFTLELEQSVLKYSRYSAAGDYHRKWTVTSGPSYSGSKSWLESDSCMLLRVLAVTDRHDCRVTFPESALPSETVYHHLNPDLKMETRYPDQEETGWTLGMSPVYISRGDSVGIKVTLTQGDRPWDLICSPRGSIAGIHGVDTVFALDTGDYRLTAEHEHCDIPASYGQEVKIQYLDTGYLRLKVWLDGPLDLTSGQMYRDEKVKLPLYGLAALPAPPKPNLQAIDWIEVELRNGSDIDSIAVLGKGALVITRDTCLLWADGTVTDRLGDTTVMLREGCAGSFNNYYVVVRHRNHLAVMTNKRYTVSKTREKGRKAEKADFTDVKNLYFSKRHPKPENHVSHLQSGGREYWALSAGDMNANRLVSIFDPNQVSLEELDVDHTSIPAPNGYHPFDVNFDGEIGWPGWNASSGNNTLDWDRVRANRYKFTEIIFKVR